MIGSRILILALAVLLPLNALSSSSSFTLWQLPNQTPTQMMSYVIKTRAGRVLVIDGGNTGDAAYLRGFIGALGNEVEAWFISHAHDDHFGALSRILSEPFAPRIRKLYGSLPTLSWIEDVGDEPQEIAPYAEFLKVLERRRLPITDLPAGAKLVVDGIHIEALAGWNPEIRINSINNSSAVWRFSDRKRSILFTSDLGVEAGRKLLASPLGRRIPSDYLQTAHHGQNGADEDFYWATKAKYCLWPTPLWLWNNDKGEGKGSGPWKTLEVRAWMEKLGIRRHFVMTEGLLVIE
jgi:beta-lactamase superfamily II metal-dependent hydrolase